MARRHRDSKPATLRRFPPGPSARKGAGWSRREAQDTFPAAAQSFARWEWLFLAALVVVVLLVYQPAWQGGLIWDDDDHVTRPDLRSWQGLYRIWFDVRKGTMQYYPLLHSAFWVEHKLWGDATLGYHLVNILQHAAAAIMVALILRRLAVPGAYLAAAIFALHPVHVESVAWITEQKNTLSALFYLGAMLAYLRFDRTRKTPWYLGSLGLFVLGVLSKTVIATLPGALLVIFWWQRGRLSWKKDLLPLAPFCLLGAGAGMITAWWELKVNGSVGPDFQFTAIERLLIAGRAVWFHLWKLCWPTNLTFIYPRWRIDSGAWWQYLFPLGLAALAAGLCSIRRRTRAPLAALLFFGGTLFPVLGFFDLYTFRFSLIANHYQYLASLGIITLASAGAALLMSRWRPWGRLAGYLLCVTLLATLAALTWRQSRMYTDVETLYRTTLDANPDCWLAHNNLANVLAGCGRVEEAIAHYQKAMQLRPDEARAPNNLAMALIGRGQVDEAITYLRRALEIKPDFAEIQLNLGTALVRRGQVEEAIPCFRKALEIKPDLATAHFDLGTALVNRGRVEEAIPCFRKALEIKPDFAEAHLNLGTALDNRGQIEEAIACFRKVLEIKPDFAEAHYNLGMTLYRQGKDADAAGQFREAVRRLPSHLAFVNQLAWVLATCADASIRNAAEAVELAQRAVALCQDREPAVLGTLAAAYAESGQFSKAVETAERAIALASARGDHALADTLRARLKLYQAGSPYHESSGQRPK